MALNLYSGNHLEHLAEIFCKEIYRKPCGNIFEPEQVVVQTGGMELFLRKYLAKHSEISANLETPFLNRFVNNIMHALLTPEEYEAYRFSAEQYSPDVLKWRIFDELKNNPEKYPEATKYASTPEHCHQLSAQLARTFDRYIWYHHKKLFQWRQTPEQDEHWEKNLYLALAETAGPSPDHFLADIQKLSAPAAPQFLASRYSLFGIGSIPPILLDFCKKTAEFTDIYLFYLNPCQAYWGDMKSDFQLRREARENNLPEPELQIHNPLLANSGAWGRDFFENTLDVMNGSPGEESFVSPEHPEQKLLHRIQLDILNSINSTPLNEENPQPECYADDRSIAIHNCHNCRREVEVLHDQLLLALDELKIRPDDIIVMAPDINVYAPYIETIFSSGKLANSFGISDRSLTALSSTAENFLKLLDLHSSRCTAAELYAFLHTPAIRENFDFADSDMESIQNFITSANICWGENAVFRKEYGTSEFEDFSWQEGFDRLLLGYAAVESDDDKLSTDWTPACNVFGTEAELLGKLIAVVNKIFEWRSFSSQNHTASQWITSLEEMLDYLYGRAYSRTKETGFIRSCLNSWLKNTRKAVFEQPFSIKILKKELSGLLNGTSDSHGYLTQGITFCSLVPMRSIPAKVIAVLGLKAQDFPRKDVNSTLNIFPAVRGERSRLLEDRYLFLETIMAARERLLLFYPGQGTDEKSNMSPSIPLADLSKYLSECFGFKETRQYRHGYAAEYFSSANPESFSYSEHFCNIAQKLREETGKSTPAVWNAGTAVTDPEGSVKQLTEYSINSLAWLLSDPLPSFIKHNFGISPYKAKDFSAPEQEPFDYQLSLDSIQKIFTEQETVSSLSGGLERSRKLPPGAHGQYCFEQTLDSLNKKTLDTFRNKMRVSEKIPLDIILDNRYRLYDLHWQVRDTGELLYLSLYNNDRAYLEFYLAHLANTIQTNGTAAEPALACLKEAVSTLQILSLDEAKARLTALFQIAEEARNRPLPIFPDISRKFAKDGNLDDAIKAFTTACLNTTDNAHLQKFFGKTPFENDDFTDEFQQLARLVYQPWSIPVPTTAQEETDNE